MANGVRPEIESLFSDVFDFADAISLETSRGDVPKWDSLQHIALVTAVEQRFGISLSMDEMVEMRSVQDIQNVLTRHGV
ncbi:MAG: acyl carrier protein [Hyphomicrobiales bacterium]|nr:acyl carrier protein [Hyphomicrobiales bacterium]